MRRLRFLPRLGLRARITIAFAVGACTDMPSGLPVGPIRDRLTGSGITINGLPVSLPRGGSNGFQSFGEHYLTLYYEHCVIGGPDSFVIGIDDLTLFEVAIRRKLLLEIAGMPSRPRLASYYPAGGPVFDCSMIGTTAR